MLWWLLLYIPMNQPWVSMCPHPACAVCAQLLSRVQLSAIPWTAACQGLLSMGFFRQESLPSGSFQKPLIFIHGRTDRMKATTTEN